MNLHVPEFGFENTYANELEGFFVAWQAATAPQPELIFLNEELAEELGLEPETLKGEAGAALFSGNQVPDGAALIAQAYAGHQFGGFSAQLGDGRALMLGEVKNIHGERRDIQLKGSGRTPFSRGGDGKAVLGPVLREYVMGEAMHALGVPTTRGLAVVTTGEDIQRDGIQPGAILTRVAASHLRVGTFQFFAARGEDEKVRKLADYAIARHYPHLVDADDKYLAFLSAVIDAQIALVAKWVHVGFVHGVMNTDNVTISGETIDYGPCAFIDSYDPAAVFSSIDTGGRYAFGNQPVIAQWNLARFAETLLPLIDPKDNDNAIRLATNEVNGIPARYTAIWLDGMRHKIGLVSEEGEDTDLVNNMFQTMEGEDVDYTRFFRGLADAADGKTDLVLGLFSDPAHITAWLSEWQNRCLRDPQSPSERRAAMNRTNPIYIPRNHKVEEALDAAAKGDLEPFKRLLDTLSAPYDQRANLEAYESPAPNDFGPYKTFCGT
ncbi:MAG: protein adenylyltransferase SelO [Oceanococcus sp.]